MNRFSTATEGQRLRLSFFVSVLVTALGLGLLGMMLRPRPIVAPPEVRQPFLVAIRLAPRAIPKPRPKVKMPPQAHRVRPRLTARRATLRAASPRRVAHATPHPLNTGGGPSSAPALAAPSASPTSAAPVQVVHIVKDPLSPLAVSLRPPGPLGAPTLPVLPPGGSAQGQGTGGGNGTGSGAGNGQGIGGGGGSNPYGAGSGGSGNGEGQRHIVYVLDISGSMTSRIDRARKELHAALAGLQPGELFDIIAFSSDVRVFSDGMNPATPEMVSQANFFLSTLQVTGGTNLEGALSKALQIPDVNVVFVITDGVPTDQANGDDIPDTKKYMAAFPGRVRAWNIHRARIYTVGLVGKDPDGRDESFEAAGMLRQISRDSGGESKIVESGVATPD